MVRATDLYNQTKGLKQKMIKINLLHDQTEKKKIYDFYMEQLFWKSENFSLIGCCLMISSKQFNILNFRVRDWNRFKNLESILESTNRD